LPIGSLNANCIAKNRIPFGFSNMWGKSEHHTFPKILLPASKPIC
jgi:hypothetical protein